MLSNGQKGIHLIGALKTNRVIYPKGVNIQINDFTKYIEKNDVCLVIVNNSKYWFYRYEGKLNGIDNAVVLFCWSENPFKNCIKESRNQIRYSLS